MDACLGNPYVPFVDSGGKVALKGKLTNSSTTLAYPLPIRNSRKGNAPPARHCVILVVNHNPSPRTTGRFFRPSHRPSPGQAHHPPRRLPITNCHLPSLLCNTSHFSLSPPTRGRRQHIPPPSSSLSSPPCRQ
ncbi:hypothetical protein BDP81DRAFT_70410 [Colletotrichum phormii]|uniref:Uncharacterized protein n=1 Tax=Colletotrichum phormii TaxID=359342 RepID=A0AAI9ZN73_9PEZI|nr:uncharacterized protein BDP81DRAFT_70410 [Colletotrichum phormii]KAK1633734.1 hypothetical protein BDP81DRAFT_70410 [Colletotrichum phormii]